MNLNKTSSIYKIVNTVNKKCYVSSSVQIGIRWQQHRRFARLQQHHSAYFQHAWNKYGEIAFEFKILQIVDESKLVEIEQEWIDWLKATDRNFGYNLRVIANSNLGIKFSNQAKENMSKGQRIVGSVTC